MPATEPILRVSDAALRSGELALIGFIRTIYDPGAEQPVTSGAAPMLLWVEGGTLAVTSTQGTGPVVVSNAGSAVAESLSSPMDAGEAFPPIAENLGALLRMDPDAGSISLAGIETLPSSCTGAA